MGWILAVFSSESSVTKLTVTNGTLSVLTLCQGPAALAQSSIPLPWSSRPKPSMVGVPGCPVTGGKCPSFYECVCSWVNEAALHYVMVRVERGLAGLEPLRNFVWHATQESSTPVRPLWHIMSLTFLFICWKSSMPHSPWTFLEALLQSSRSIRTSVWALPSSVRANSPPPFKN